MDKLDELIADALQDSGSIPDASTKLGDRQCQ